MIIQEEDLDIYFVVAYNLFSFWLPRTGYNQAIRNRGVIKLDANTLGCCSGIRVRYEMFFFSFSRSAVQTKRERGLGIQAKNMRFGEWDMTIVPRLIGSLWYSFEMWFEEGARVDGALTTLV